MNRTGNSERGGSSPRMSAAEHAAGFGARGLKGWMLALSAGWVLAAGGAAVAQSAAGGAGTLHISGRSGLSTQPGGAASAGSTSAGESQFSIMMNENGKSVRLEMKNDVVTLAEVDGKRIPDSQIEREGDTIRLKDDKGNVLFEHDIGVGTTTSMDPFQAMSRYSAIAGLSGNNTWLLRNRPGTGTVTVIGPQDLGAAVVPSEPAETPTVMVGVQMAEPDAILRGHLGIKENVSTMVMGIHKGLPAAKAGLAPYDLIVAIDGQEDADPDAIRAALRGKKPGETVALGVIHQGQRKDIKLTVEAYDRKKLSEAEVEAIAGMGESGLGLTTASGGAWPSPFAGAFGSKAMTPQDREKLLANIAEHEASARKAAEDARQQMLESFKQWRDNAGQGFGPASGMEAEMQRRMERMESLLQQLLKEKPDAGKSEEPSKEDQRPGAGGRSFNSGSQYISSRA